MPTTPTPKPPAPSIAAQLLQLPAAPPAAAPIVINVATGATLHLTVALPGHPPDRP